MSTRDLRICPTLLVSLFVVLALFVGLFSGAAQAQSTAQIAKQALPAVVTIRTQSSAGEGSGSGFVVDSTGLIATNYHVINKVDSAKVEFNWGDVYSVVGVVTFDPVRDYAILKINAVELPVLQVGNSNNVQPGEGVIALGSPLGTFTGSVSTGVVSQVRQKGEHRVIQHTAAISPGSSGGPLLNMAGQVIGLNTFSVEGGQSLFFALPINYVRGGLAGSSGKLIALNKLSAAVEMIEEEAAKIQLLDAIKKNFYAYEDPGGLYELLLPRNWQVQTNRYYDDENGGTSHLVMMAYARDAERAELNGWLSAGIRVHLRMPPEGKSWRKEWYLTWRQTMISNLLAGYDNQRSETDRDSRFGNLQAERVTVAGTSNQLSKPEGAFLYVAVGPGCLMVVEVVMPLEEAETLQAFDAVMGASFQAGWQ